MTDSQAIPGKDQWSEWLLGRRHADNQAYADVVRAMLQRIRDRVVDGACLQPGMTIADIGTGDGLIAFEAIGRVGLSGSAYLTDVSGPLLLHAKRIATELGFARQCTFLQGSADKLDGIVDLSIDVAMTRAVLAYVTDKPAAFRELYRVLKPAGRISIAEPIFKDQALEAMALTKTVGQMSRETNAVGNFLRLVQRWKAAQFPTTEEQINLSPIANFSERDLVRLAQSAGFVDIHLELHIDVRPSSVTNWDVFLGTSPHPLAPSLQTILETQFSADERRLFERVMRPIVEARKTVETDAIAYLTASKPPACSADS